jgi:hypothetical protein
MAQQTGGAVVQPLAAQSTSLRSCRSAVAGVAAVPPTGLERFAALVWCGDRCWLVEMCCAVYVCACVCVCDVSCLSFRRISIGEVRDYVVILVIEWGWWVCPGGRVVNWCTSSVEVGSGKWEVGSGKWEVGSDILDLKSASTNAAVLAV